MENAKVNVHYACGYPMYNAHIVMRYSCGAITFSSRDGFVLLDKGYIHLSAFALLGFAFRAIRYQIRDECETLIFKLKRALS